MIRCMGCMEEFDEEYEVCPHCGYVVNTPPKEAYHLLPSTRLHNGKYSVGRVLGNGGFGVTYIGWDEVLGHKVAIKEYFPGEFSTRVPGESQISVYSGDREEQFNAGKEKFIEEAQRLAKFNQTKGVVHVYDYFEENKTAYIIMEYLEGESYKERLKKKGRLSVEEARDVIIAVLEALEVVHKEGIIHRDISPDNIMLTRDGEITLLDFGASRFATTKHSKSLSVILKPGYAPEEQYRSRGDQGPWTDVYAVAATFYKLVTGETPQASIERSTKDLVKKPSKMGVSIPKNLENAVMNAMNIRIEGRTQSAKDFLIALHADKVKRKREKIKAADIGKWPLWVKISVPIAIACVGTFLTLLLTGVIHFDILQTSLSEIPEGYTRVPSVMNMTYDDAVVILEASDLKVSVSGRESSNEVPENMILQQSVESGVIVAKSSTIQVVVSEGVEKLYVPNLTDLYKDEAIQELIERNVEYELIEVYSESAPGAVVYQSIEPETEINDSMTMEVKISCGLPQIDTAQETKMPDVVGMRYSAAKEALINESLYIVKDNIIYDETIPYEYIMGQGIEKNQVVNMGTALPVEVNMAKGKIDVPEVKNKVYANILSSLEELYFNVNVEYQYDDKVAKGNIISSTPAQGSSVDVGSDLLLSVSQGKKPTYSGGSYGGYYDDYYSRDVTVPNIVGQSVYTVEDSLRQYPLYISRFNIVKEYGNQGVGTILEQSPAGGTVVKAGSEITVRYCAGPESVSVPNLVGLTCQEAYMTCINMGIKVYPPTSDYMSRVVAIQSIDPGTVVSNGTFVSIYVLEDDGSYHYSYTYSSYLNW